jgi:predicted small lipoprotein YifL
MKTLILSCVATAALFTLSGCESDGDHDEDHDHRRAQVTTTTTEESTVRHPVQATTETRTIRSY